MKTRSELLTILAQYEGYSTFEDWVVATPAELFDSVVPAICVNCEAVVDMEPDQDRGYCEECGTNTVKSALILAGII